MKLKQVKINRCHNSFKDLKEAEIQLGITHVRDGEVVNDVTVYTKSDHEVGSISYRVTFSPEEIERLYKYYHENKDHRKD